MNIRGNSTLIDLLIFYILVSTGIALLISAGDVDTRDEHVNDLAYSVLNSLLFSTTDGKVGYQIQGYSKNLAGKSWAEVIMESAFLYVHEPEVGRKLAENLQVALDRKIRDLLPEGFLVSFDIISIEPNFSIHAGENVNEPSAVASTTLFSPLDGRLGTKVEVKICRK